MKKTKVAVWWRFLSDNTVYSQANYEADVESLKDVYQAKGYKDVVVKDPILDVYVVNPKAKPEKIKRRVRITIPIVQGEKFYTNDITITRVLPSGQPADPPDVTVFPTRLLLKEFKELTPGTVLDRDKLVTGLAAIEAMYKTRGYIYWFADPVYKEVGKDRVDVDVHMFEGEKFYLGRLEVQGNTLTRDKVVRREFGLDEGDVMDMEAVKKSIQKISAARLLQARRGAPVLGPSGRAQGRPRPEGPGDEPQRDPVRRRVLGLRRVLRPGLISDAQLPRPRRGPRHLRAGGQGFEVLRPLVHGAVVHGQEPVGGELDLQPRRHLYDRPGDDPGRHHFLRQGARAVRFGFRPVFL